MVKILGFNFVRNFWQKVTVVYIFLLDFHQKYVFQ